MLFACFGGMGRITAVLLIWICAFSTRAQDTCIVADTVVCLSACETILYNGPGSDTASYSWTSTCGTFTNPNARQPGDHCFFFSGNCTLQVIVQEPGLLPDTCTLTVEVVNNPDGVLEGDTTICAGSCTSLIVDFISGTPPFAYAIDDGSIIHFYTSQGMADTVDFCPLFTSTYTLQTISDGIGCTSQDTLNSVEVEVLNGISATITQNGSLLCANPPGQNYQWYNCEYTELLAITQCVIIPEDTCFCVVVSDSETGMCVDTVCGDFEIPCELSCTITAPDSICPGEDFVFNWSTNGSAAAEYNINLETNGGPGTLIITTDLITVPNDGSFSCVTITIEIIDGDCQTICIASQCESTHLASASLGNDVVSCDSCVSLPVTLSGIPPFTLFISDGSLVDTIENIADSLFLYAVCPMAGETVTYSIINVTDSLNQCQGEILDTSATVFLYGTPVAAIHQAGNQLCAGAADGATFEWYDCDFTQLLTFDSCFSIADTGCYCLVVTDPFCTDTICGTFESVPCELTCSIVMPDTACLEESMVFSYTGNASPSATFTWLIDVPGFPMMPITGNDTVIMSYSDTGCYGVTLQVFDLGCVTTCMDTVCVIPPESAASICCGIEACDICTLIEITLAGIAPWTVYITDGLDVDTIIGIASSPYFHEVCPPLDTTITYSLVEVIDGTNTCPAAIVGDTFITVTLHPYPVATITQRDDTLCATADTLLSYRWYTCPVGITLDTNRCFVPMASGCYCVDVSSQFDCLDTACYNIILSEVKEMETPPALVFPNPSTDQFVCTITDLRYINASWTLHDLIGRPIATGIWHQPQHTFTWPADSPAGMYILQLMQQGHPPVNFRLIHQ